MNLNLKIKDLSYKQLETIKFRCLECNYWFDYDELNFLKELTKVRSISELKGFLKGKLFKKSQSKKNERKITGFKMHGGKVKAAFVDRKCIGIILAGNYYLFPRLKSFNVFPPDFKSIFLGCIYVIPEYKGMNVGKRLLIEIEKELVKEKVKSIESIGKRLNDDMDEDEYENSPLIPFKFLINNGFYLKKNDPLFPLLRLDLKKLAVDFSQSRELVGKMALEKEIGVPLIIKNK